MEIYLERLNGDVWTIEATENDFDGASRLRAVQGQLKKKVAVGVVSHRTLQVDSPRRSPPDPPRSRSSRLRTWSSTTAASGGRAATGTSPSTRRRRSHRRANIVRQGARGRGAPHPGRGRKARLGLATREEQFTHLKPLSVNGDRPGGQDAVVTGGASGSDWPVAGAGGGRGDRRPRGPGRGGGAGCRRRARRLCGRGRCHEAEDARRRRGGGRRGGALDVLVACAGAFHATPSTGSSLTNGTDPGGEPARGLPGRAGGARVMMPRRAAGS